MARIPLGNAGNRMPGQVRAPQIAEAGVQTGRALERLGATGVDIGFQREQVMLAEKRAEFEKQQAAAEAAARADDTAKLLTGQDRLRDIHDEVAKGVLDGTIPKDQAETQWTERSRKAVDELLPSLREQARPLVQPQLVRLTSTLGNGVRKAREERDRKDVTVSLDSIFETASRGYARDQAGMTALVESAAGQLGGQSLYPPEVLARKVQKFKEDGQFSIAFAAVEAGRSDPKGLDAAAKMLDTLPDLDPQKRAVLNDRISDARMRIDQKRELQAQAAARRAEAALKRAEATFTAATSLADKGVLNPEYADNTLRTLAGTPYAAAFKALVDQQAVTGNLAAMPISVQQRELDRVNAQVAQGGITPALEKRRNQLQAVVNGSRQDLDRDPLRAGLERSVITELQPLNLGGGVQDILPQMQQRVQQAEIVGQWAGRVVSPLTADEAGALKQRLDTLPAKDRSQFIGAMSAALGPRASAGLAEQLDKKDRGLALAFAKAGDQTTEGRFTSELILKGQQAKSDGTSTKGDKAPDVKASAWKAHASAALDGVFPDQRHMTQVRDAAELIMHGIAAEQGGRLSKDDMERAVRLAVGGSLVEHNGRNIPLPAGKTAADLERTFERMKPEAIPGGAVRVNGQQMPAAEFIKTLPGQKLVPVRPGQYAVEVSGRYVLDAAGAPLIIKLD